MALQLYCDQPELPDFVADAEPLMKVEFFDAVVGADGRASTETLDPADYGSAEFHYSIDTGSGHGAMVEETAVIDVAVTDSLVATYQWPAATLVAGSMKFRFVAITNGGRKHPTQMFYRPVLE